MRMLRLLGCIALTMVLVQSPAGAAAPKPKVTKQVVVIKSNAGDIVGKGVLTTTTVNRRSTRSLSVKVSNFSLPLGTRLGVRINTASVTTGDVVQEVDNYDTDGDGIPNDQDTDDDNDGINDSADLDDDDDGIPDSQEDDADDDGIPDLQDDDDDDDGILDDDEDNDGDGIPDDEDDDADGDGTADDEEDSDDDDIPDSEDEDDDNDGIPDDLDDDDDGDGIPDDVDPDYSVISGKMNVTANSGVPATAKGATLSVRLPNGLVIASGKF